MLPPLLTLAQLLAAYEEPPVYVVGELLTAGDISMLVAHPKAGKSTLVRNLVRAAAHGTSFFLGRDVPKQTVLYYVLEEQAAFVADELRQMQINPDSSVYVRAGYIPRLTVIGLLEQDIVKTGATLAVIDPLFDALAVDDVNSYTKVNEAMKALLQVARRTSSHIMTVHHTNKSDLRGGLTVLGSQALAASTSCNLFLTLRRDGTRLIETQNRSGTAIELATLGYTPATREVWLDGDVKEDRQEALRSALLLALEGGPLTYQEWRARVKGRNTDKAQAIVALATAGEVVKDEGERGRAVWKRRNGALSTT